MANVEQELVDAKRYLAEVAEKLQRLESLRKGAEEEYVDEKAILERQETKSVSYSYLRNCLLIISKNKNFALYIKPDIHIDI